MKAKIVDGVLLLSAENETEDFALKCFREKSYVSIRDETTNTDGYWLGGKISIVTKRAEDEQRMIQGMMNASVSKDSCIYNDPCLKNHVEFIDRLKNGEVFYHPIDERISYHYIDNEFVYYTKDGKFQMNPYDIGIENVKIKTANYR